MARGRVAEAPVRQREARERRVEHEADGREERIAGRVRHTEGVRWCGGKEARKASSEAVNRLLHCTLDAPVTASSPQSPAPTVGYMVCT